MEMPADAVAALQTGAGSGNDVAKAVLADLGMAPSPEKKEEPEQKAENAPTEPVKAEEPKTEEPKVEAERERTQRTEKRPSRLDTIRDLRRKRRELEAALDAKEQEHQKRLADLEAKIDALGKNGSHQTAEDELSALLSKPGDYLSQREERLLKNFEKMLEERIGKIPLPKQESPRDAAFKILDAIDDFDMEENQEDLYKLLNDEGYEESDIEELARRTPVQFAKLVERVWKHRNDLPAPEVSAKAAAASSAAIAGKPPLGPKPTLKELNAQFADAMARGDEKAAEAIQKEIMANLK